MPSADRNKKNRLHKIKLRELSLVDRGANQRADVVLTKRHEDAPMLFDEVLDAFTTLTTD